MEQAPFVILDDRIGLAASGADLLLHKPDDNTLIDILLHTLLHQMVVIPWGLTSMDPALSVN